jgi:hypothetical protein
MQVQSLTCLDVLCPAANAGGPGMLCTDAAGLWIYHCCFSTWLQLSFSRTAGTRKAFREDSTLQSHNNLLSMIADRTSLLENHTRPDAPASLAVRATGGYITKPILRSALSELAACTDRAASWRKCRVSLNERRPTTWSAITTRYYATYQ